MTIRYRLKYNFWLNINDAAQEQIADIIEVLKSKRLFAKTIRDGIRLVHDLRQGSLDVLFELFPYVKSEFLKYIQDAVGHVRTENDIDMAHDAYQNTQHLKDMIALQTEEIERLTLALEKSRSKPSEDFEALINRAVSKAMAQNTPRHDVNGATNASPPSGGIRAIGNVSNAPMPVFDDADDDLMEVVASTIDRKEVGMNFLRSLGALNQ